MSAVALDPLIAEAKRRARRRHLLVLAMAVAALGGATVYAIAHGGRPSAVTPRVSIPAGATGVGCGLRGVGGRILSPAGRTLYREPGDWAHPNRGFPEIRCSGSTVWAVWFNGAAAGNEAYLGARSPDRGRTWRPVFSNPYFGANARYSLGQYLGVWALRGARDAYFTGRCPACGHGKRQGTVSLWVTTDDGRAFRSYDVPALTGFEPRHLRITRNVVTISATAFTPGAARRKAVTVRLG